MEFALTAAFETLEGNRQKREKTYRIEVLKALLDRRDGLTAKEIFDAVKPRVLNEESWPKRIVSQLRKDLEKSRKGRGQFHDWRLEVPPMDEEEGLYQVIPVPNTPPQSFEGLWWPYLWRKNPGDQRAPETHVVITEPTFFRHVSDRFYIRHFEVNSEDASLLLAKLPALGQDPNSFIYAPHYVSLGEVIAAHTIMDGLREISQSIPIQFKSDLDILGDLRGTNNWVLLGTSRASKGISDFQKLTPSLYYRHEDYGVSQKDEKPLPDCPGTSYYGVFTRISDRKARHVRSIIACNHGPATRAIAKYLFLPAVRSELIPQMTSGKPWKGFPDQFQILFKVTLSNESTPTVEYINWAPLEMGRSV